MKKTLLSMVTCLPLSTLAAEWNSSVEGGYSQSRGNSDIEALYLSASTHYEAARYGAEAKVKMDRQASNGELTKEYYLADAKVKRYFSAQHRGYLFTAAQWEQDAPNGHLGSWSLTGGPGYQWQLPSEQTLSIEAGIGYQHSNYEEDTRDYDGTVARFFAAYAYPVNQAVTFKADTLSFFDEQRHLNTTNIKLESVLIQRLSLGAGFEYRYNSKPDVGKRSEDTTLRLTLKYAF